MRQRKGEWSDLHTEKQEQEEGICRVREREGPILGERKAGHRAFPSAQGKIWSTPSEWEPMGIMKRSGVAVKDFGGRKERERVI